MRKRIKISGSSIGSLSDHMEVLEFCAKHNITSDITLVEAKDIDYAWEQINGKNKDAVRYVIDIKKSLENKDFLPP
jgi:D-arabinose 1-dehydrogenase-like Zn-dependent alcohol dehydrogenase